MTVSDKQQCRNGTGVFIPACMLQESGVPEDVDDSCACAAEHLVKRQSVDFKRSVEPSASGRRSRSFTRGASAFAPGNAYSGPSSASDDPTAVKMYQQSALYSPSPAAPAGPTAPRPPSSSAHAATPIAGRTSRRCSVDSTLASRRTTRRYSVDGTSLQQWASTRSTSSAKSSSSSTAFQSALYAPAGYISPAGVQNDSGIRRISVDLHNMRAAGVNMSGAPAAAGRGAFPSLRDSHAAEFTRAGRCSFDVGSGVIGYFEATAVAPLPAAAAATAAPGAPYILQKDQNFVSRNSSIMMNSQDTCYDTLQLQQQDNMVSHNGLSHQVTPSPTAAAAAEQARDNRIQAVLIDILNLDSQLAAAADAAGVGAVPADLLSQCSRGQQQQTLVPFCNQNILMSSPEVNSATLLQQQQQTVGVPALQMGPCSLAPVPLLVGATASPRNSIDMLLLPQQQQQVLLSPAAVAGDAASMTPIGMSPITVGAAFPALELDAIDESPADVTAYLIHRQQQTGKSYRYTSAVSGGGAPVLFSSSPPTATAAGLTCGGLPGFQTVEAGATRCNQAGDEVSPGYTHRLSPEAQAKLQELMAAQQLKMEIQSELMTMLTSA